MSLATAQLQMLRSNVEFVVIGVYLVALVAVGFAFRRFNRDSADYFRSGNQGSWWLVGTSSFMGCISALTFTGNGGAAFEAGPSVLLIYLGNIAAFALCGWCFAKWFRQMRVTTFPEVLRDRFNPATQQAYAYFFLVTFLFSSAVWLWGLGIFASVVLGLPLEIVIPVLGLVCLVYSTTGGRWAVMGADFLQGMILMPMTILLSLICLHKVGWLGGFSSLVTERGLESSFTLFKPEGAFPGGAYTWKWALAILALQITANVSVMSAPRYFSTKHGKEASRSAWLTCALMLVGTIFWFIPPMTARLLFDEQVMASTLSKPQESAFAIVSMQLLPGGMIGLMVVAMFSATLSSMDSGLNGNAAVVIRDILPQLRRLFGRTEELPPAVELRLSRIFTACFGVLITLLAYRLATTSSTGMLETFLTVAAAMLLPLIVPLVLGILVKRVPPWAALFSVGCGLVPALIPLVTEVRFEFHERVLWAIAAGSGGFLVTSLLWKRTDESYRARVAAFFDRMTTEVNYGKEVGEDLDRRQAGILGTFCLVVGLLVLLLLFVQDSNTGRLGILFVATANLLVGAILRIAGSWSARSRAANPIAVSAAFPGDAPGSASSK